MVQIMDWRHIKVKKTSVLRNPFTLLIFAIVLEPVYNVTIYSLSPDYMVVRNDGDPNIDVQLQHSLEILKKIIEQKEKDELARRLPDDIVRLIKLTQFSEAEQKLQQTTDNIYAYAVHEVYNNQIGNFDLLLRFGHSIRDMWSRYKIYKALREEMKANDHNDINKLLRLYVSIKKGILDRRTDTIDGQSLYNASWSLIREDIPNLIAYSIFISEDGPIIRLGNEESFSDKIDIWKQVLERLWNRVHLVDICNRAREYQKNIDVQIAFEIALFHQLERVNLLNKNEDVITLARHMKLTMNDPDYLFVNNETKSQHEQIKNKLPQSVKNLVLSSAVCLRNIVYDEYLCSGFLEDQYDQERRRVFTCIYKDSDEQYKFKWTVSFVDDYRIRLSNQYNEYLYSEYDGSKVNPLNGGGDFVFTNITSGNHHNDSDPQSTQEQWDIRVDGPEILCLKNHRQNQYLHADCCIIDKSERRGVFTYRPKHWHPEERPKDSEWEIIDCSKL